MKKIALFLSAVLLLTLLVGCSAAPDEAFILESVTSLVEASYEVNDIFFGEGLPAIARDSDFAIENYVYYMDYYDNYDYLTADCPYTHTDQIKALAETVYSEDYLSSIYETMFVGLADETAGMLYARYLDTEEGLRKSNIHSPMIEKKRVYDYSTMTIVKPTNGRFINVEIDTHLEGEADILRIRLTLVREDDGWRLDTPTY